MPCSSTRAFPHRFRRVVDRREHGEIAHTPLCRAENAAKLANLRFLSLYDNNLWSLRRISVLGATACPRLVELDIGKNDLGELPEEFALLAHLERLWAEDNHLRAFPPALLRLRRLKELRLSNNQIDSVPEAVGDALGDLEVLAVDNNQLAALPAGLGRLTKLRKLIARGNRIEALPDALVARLAQLEVCAVSSNRLAALPAFEGCPRLRALYANGNRIRAVPPHLASLADLTKVNLANNEIASDGLPPAVAKKWGFAPAAGAGEGAGEGAGADGDVGMAAVEVDATLAGNPVVRPAPEVVVVEE